jgi:hypothetical protein
MPVAVQTDFLESQPGLFTGKARGSSLFDTSPTRERW